MVTKFTVAFPGSIPGIETKYLTELFVSSLEITTWTFPVADTEYEAECRKRQIFV
jgi:hypothetical protein